ncbi:phosphonate ABC transporter ATP-binding protein [Luteimicrobium sp. DT211]|uniref:phosphonate ABC transporter ATP-binding protein n=1 Tax=Luteimicrobium sp. DT211 TaxID=3393412 RepID=UPI003CF1EE92
MIPPLAAPPLVGLTVRDLAVEFPGLPPGRGRAVDGLDLHVAPGEIVAVLGANGCGKSTTLRAVAGLTPMTHGIVHVGSELVRDASGAGAGSDRAHRREVAMIFQQVNLVPRLTVLDNVCAGALGRLPLVRSLAPGLFPHDVRAEAMWCLEQVGLADRALQRAGRLSGGQQQRVAVARALCQRPSVLLADEPTSALDPAAAEKVAGLLTDLTHAQRLATVLVAHDPPLALRHVDRVLGMSAGRIVLDRPAADVTAPDVAALYPSETAPRSAA